MAIFGSKHLKKPGKDPLLDMTSTFCQPKVLVWVSWFSMWDEASKSPSTICNHVQSLIVVICSFFPVDKSMMVFSLEQCVQSLFLVLLFSQSYFFISFSACFRPWYILPKSGSNWADFNLNNHSPFWSVARAVPYSSMCPDVATVTWFVYIYVYIYISISGLVEEFWVTPKQGYS